MVLLDWPPPDHLWIGRSLSISAMRLDDRASAQQARLRSGTSPELRLPTTAAQTRIVSVASIRLDSRKSARFFNRITCADLSEFESHMPSHAVGLFERCWSDITAS